MNPRTALRLREEPGLGTKVEMYGLFEGLWGTPQGELWKKRELDPSWESLNGKVLDGVKLEGRKEQESPAHP